MDLVSINSGHVELLKQCLSLSPLLTHLVCPHFPETKHRCRSLQLCPLWFLDMLVTPYPPQPGLLPPVNSHKLSLSLPLCICSHCSLLEYLFLPHFPTVCQLPLPLPGLLTFVTSCFAARQTFLYTSMTASLWRQIWVHTPAPLLTSSVTLNFDEDQMRDPK